MKKYLPLFIVVCMMVSQLSSAQISPPIYDICVAAVSVPVSTSLTCTGAIIFHNMVTSASAAGLIPLPGCGSFTDGVTPDVWFHFGTLNASYHQIEVDPENNGGATDLAMALYTGGCNGPWTLLACDDNSNGANMPMIGLNNLASGTDVYIRIWSNNGTTPGNFRVCVLAYNTTDIQQNTIETVSIFPNPFESKITFSSALKNCTVKIYSSVGAVVFTAQQDEISEVETSHLKAGLYLVEITSGDHSAFRKVIKL